MNEKSTDEQLIDLQSRLAFQEHTIEELNKVVSDQSAQIDLLQQQLQHLWSQFKQLQETQTAETGGSPIEIPPHY